MKDVQQSQALKVRKTLDYGYACTVHKSQGGTYNKIMYYADTVAPFDKKVQNQLDYVAVSRAKENVYIVTNHEIKEQNGNEQEEQRHARTSLKEISVAIAARRHNERIDLVCG